MYQKPCVFEGPNAELREGSLISDHKTLNFDRGLNFEQICPQPRIKPIKPIKPIPSKRCKTDSSQLPQHAPGVRMTVVLNKLKLGAYGAHLGFPFGVPFGAHLGSICGPFWDLFLGIIFWALLDSPPCTRQHSLEG